MLLPREESSRAIARPIPEEEPLIMEVLPWRVWAGVRSGEVVLEAMLV